jgi:ABC-2 type transport system ATP-binding protein
VESTPAVEISGMVKRYGPVTAVDGLTLTAGAGQVTAVLGPNGAGKTTTIEVCEGYRRIDSGTVRILGLDPMRAAALRPRVGVKRLSGGQQQRLSLAAAVIGRPELVFLDEPTAGLDPQARHATWDLVSALRHDGVGIVLTTHFMDEAERLADHVVIIDHGQAVAAGSPGELTGSAGQLRFRAEPGLDTDSLLAALPPGSAAKESPSGHYLIEVDDGVIQPALLAAVTAWCADRSVLPSSLRIESRTLEDVFLELTGRELRA